MFKNYMLFERGFRNVEEKNRIIGFQLLIKIAYYRGVFINFIGPCEVTVDGEHFDVSQMLFTIHDKTYTYEEAAYADDVHWPFGETLTLTVLKPGGLKPGPHTIHFVQVIDPSYNDFSEEVTKTMTLIA